MLEEIAVIFPSEQWRESKRGALSATVAREFPSIFVTFETDESAQPHVSASQWSRADFNSWDFDTKVDELARAPFTLRVADDRGEHAEFLLEVLNRCQRLIGRHNAHSQGKTFDQFLRRHRELHDLDKPLVRADYNHALDVWQWTLRLQPSASLAVQIAALFHDIERLVSEAETRIEQNAADYQQFKNAHAYAGAEMTRRILIECGGLPPPSIERVAQLIERHEERGDERELQLLNDADALSFFSLNSSGYADYFGEKQTRKKIAYTWNRMTAAARAKLAMVHLRDDVRAMLDEVRQ